MKKVFYTVFFITIIIFISASAFAKYNITPGISIREEYNDNIYLDATDEEDDFITTVSPSIAFNYSTGKTLDLSLYYGLNFKFYNDHSNLNDDDIEDAQEIVFEAHTKPTKLFFIDVFDKYKKVPIDVRRKTALDNVHENMTNKNEFSISPYVKVPLTTTVSVTGGYSYINIWHDDDRAVSYDNHSAYLTLDKKFNPRMNVFLKYKYIAHRPDSEDIKGIAGELEYDRHEASSGLDYRIMNDITINVEAGNSWINYTEIDDKQKFFWSLGIDNVFKFTEYTSLWVDYGIRITDSAGSGVVRSHDVGVTFETGKVLKLAVSPYYKDVKSLAINRTDRIIGVTSELSRPITKKIRASLTGNWLKRKYLPEDEDITKYSLGSNLYYSLSRSIKISAGYRYSHQNASSDIDSELIDINDYDNNIVWLQARVVF